jgi:hypothetical protein
MTDISWQQEIANETPLSRHFSAQNRRSKSLFSLENIAN